MYITSTISTAKDGLFFFDRIKPLQMKLITTSHLRTLEISTIKKDCSLPNQSIRSVKVISS